MKKSLIILSAIAGISLSSFTLNNHNEGELTLNTEVSKVEWIGKKVTGQHNGTINIQEGTLHLHDGKMETGKVVINMESIVCEDLEDENWNSKLVGHLNSADFFDVQNHKTATLEILSVSQITETQHTVKGSLTIKGITKPISFPVTIEMKDSKLAAYAEVSVDRTLYDIKYGSGKFFEGLGDKMIDDQFIVKFKIAAE